MSLCYFKTDFRDGELAQRLKALAALPKDLGFILSTHLIVQNIYNSSNRISNTLFCHHPAHTGIHISNWEIRLCNLGLLQVRAESVC